MSKPVETKLDEPSASDQPQLEVAPKMELAPIVDTRTEEQKAADERLQKQIAEYHALYERGEIAELEEGAVAAGAVRRHPRRLH